MSLRAFHGLLRGILRPGNQAGEQPNLFGFRGQPVGKNITGMVAPAFPAPVPIGDLSPADRRIVAAAQGGEQIRVELASLVGDGRSDGGVRLPQDVLSLPGPFLPVRVQLPHPAHA